MKRTTFSWSTVLLLALLALSVQGCFGFGGAPSGTHISTNNGQQVTVKQDVFKGKFYLTIGHSLYVLSGNGDSKKLVDTGNVYDPVISPDGKWVAFIQRYKQYSDLSMVSTSGGPIHVLRSGNGKFFYRGPYVHNSLHWYAQPSWSPDSTHLLFLSDLEKEDWYQQTTDAPMLDLQVFSIAVSNPAAKPQDVAYASFGDGGNRDASYRPGHDDQIIYTHYAYDGATRTQQVIQLFMENPNTISRARAGTYYPGLPGGGYDPGIAITDGKVPTLQPAFSPDGNAIAYIQRENNQMSLNVMSVPPASILQKPNDPAMIKLAVQAYQTQSSKLLSQLYVQQPAWSPDGKQLAYVTFNSGSFDLWIANVSVDAKTGSYKLQGSPIQVTTGGVDGESRPVWIN